MFRILIPLRTLKPKQISRKAYLVYRVELWSCISKHWVSARPFIAYDSIIMFLLCYCRSLGSIWNQIHGVCLLLGCLTVATHIIDGQLAHVIHPKRLNIVAVVCLEQKHRRKTQHCVWGHQWAILVHIYEAIVHLDSSSEAHYMLRWTSKLEWNAFASISHWQFNSEWVWEEVCGTKEGRWVNIVVIRDDFENQWWV